MSDGRSGGGGHLLGEQVGDGDGFAAGWTFASEPDFAHEGGALVTALFAEGACSAVVAFVDGDGTSGLGFGQTQDRSAGVAAASVGGGPAGVGAVLLAA